MYVNKEDKAGYIISYIIGKAFSILLLYITNIIRGIESAISV